MKIGAIVRRNFLIILHSKISSLILILGPIFLIMIAGFFLKDSSVKNMTAGVYIENDEEFSSSFISNLRNNGFKINQYNSVETCTKKVIDSVDHICIEIDKQERGYSSLVLYIDYSKQQVVRQIVPVVQEVIEKESNIIRGEAFEKIKTDMSDLLILSQQANKEIENALNNLDTFNLKYGELKNRLVSIQGNIDDINVNLNSIRTNLNYLKSSSNLPPNALSYINFIDTQLSNIDQDLNKADLDNFINVEMKHLDDLVSNTKSKIINLRLHLIEAENKLLTIQGMDVSRINEPIPVMYKSLIDNKTGNIGSRLRFFDYFFPSLLMLYVLFSSVIYSSMVVIRERLSGSHVRNILSPTSGRTFVIGNFISCFMIIMMQITVVLLIGSFFLNLSIFANAFSLYVALIISSVIFILFGMIIGYWLNSQESVSIMSVSLTMIFLLFSSAITPKEMLPGIVSKAVSFTPFSLFESKIVSILIFGYDFSVTVAELLSIIASFLIIIGVLILVYHKSKYLEIK